MVSDPAAVNQYRAMLLNNSRIKAKIMGTLNKMRWNLRSAFNLMTVKKLE